MIVVQVHVARCSYSYGTFKDSTVFLIGNGRFNTMFTHDHLDITCIFRRITDQRRLIKVSLGSRSQVDHSYSYVRICGINNAYSASSAPQFFELFRFWILTDLCNVWWSLPRRQSLSICVHRGYHTAPRMLPHRIYGSHSPHSKHTQMATCKRICPLHSHATPTRISWALSIRLNKCATSRVVMPIKPVHCPLVRQQVYTKSRGRVKDKCGSIRSYRRKSDLVSIPAPLIIDVLPIVIYRL